MKSDFYRTLLIKGVICVLTGVVVLGWSPGRCVAEDHLYVGGWSPNVVYEYVGGATWNVISPDLGDAVLCLIEHDGQVYAGTGSMSTGLGQVWRYDGGMSWTLVSMVLDIEVCDLVEFRGDLYAGTGYSGAKLHRYDGGTTWTTVVDYPSWCGFRDLYVWNDVMHLGDLCMDYFGRWDGTTFYYDANLGGSCIFDFEVHQDELYACAYQGVVHRSSDGVTWATIRGSQGYYSWELETFHGDLYLSTGPTLEIYDGANFVPVWTEPDGNEIISMMCTQDLLVMGTGEEAGYNGQPGVGRVYVYDGITVQLISGDMGVGIQSVGGSGAYEPSAIMPITWGEIKARFGE